MPETPLTRASLLIRLRDSRDAEAWRQFVEIYSALIYGFLRKRGLQDADAADLMQDVLQSVSGAVGRLDYDPARGSFRSWLYTITRNKLNTFLAREHRQVRGTGDSNAQGLLESRPALDDESAWEEQYQRRLFDWAAQRVRNVTGEKPWQAFWQSAVDGKNPKDIARDLQMSVGAVYVAKSRVLAQIREEIHRVQEM
jgi:RNA polymerase sigma-70 factor (ECF subfamily)